MDEEESLLLRSLQRGPVTPSAPSPGTYIPASSRAPVIPSGPAPGTYIPASNRAPVTPSGPAPGPTSLPTAPRPARKALPVGQCRCHPL
ncbi:hypothetical protein RHGRI_002873 [Rhododendron griersonianum]|uniref:Uncharacterized protein n=1 Tax=Rhododendron griersonianum TaxID=479676 RepID=A0AAV6LSR2_9ERIC|nr:hypothetical protein RHGRI_002873 [Rhododendron griersonianum]